MSSSTTTTASAEAEGAPAEFRRHWRALAGCTLAAAAGTVGLQAYTSGAFAAALSGAGAYTRTQLSVATLILSVTVALAAPVAGMVMDRLGATRVIAVAVLGEAAGFALLAAIPVSFPLFAGGMVLLALLGVGTTPPGFARVITARFDRGRGLALGIMISGLGLMAIGAPIWATGVIGWAGWRVGYLTVAALVLFLGGIGVALIRADGDANDNKGVAPTARAEGGDWSAIRRPVFWAVLAGFMAPALFSGGYLLHLIPVLEDRGFTGAQAARMQSLIGVAVLVGRLSSGAALDRFRPQEVAACAFLLSAAGCLGILAQSPLLVGAGALAIGLTIGAELDIMAYLISRAFGLASFGRLYGLGYGCMISAGGLSPVLISLVAGASGYRTALIVSAVGTAGGALILLLTRTDGKLPGKV